MKYLLEKRIDGEWWREGVYTEGYFVKHLAFASFNLGRNCSAVEDIRVTLIEEDNEDVEN